MLMIYIMVGWNLHHQIPLRCMEALQIEGRARALKIPQPKGKARSTPKAKSVPTPPPETPAEEEPPAAAPKRRVKAKSSGK